MNKLTISHLIARYLNEAVLGFSHYCHSSFFVAPLVFPVSGSVEGVMTAIELAIILLFALEYISGYILATNKRHYVKDGRRVIDILIILSATIAFIPFVPDVLKHSPVLRLIRVGRIALLGARSSIALKTGNESAIKVSSDSIADLRVMSLGHAGKKFEEISLDQGISRIRSSEPDWLFISGVGESNLIPISEALGVPVKAVQGLFKSSSPGFDTLERFSTFFVRYPMSLDNGKRQVRIPILLVGTTENIVVLSRTHTDLHEKLQLRLGNIDADAPKIVKATLALVSEIMSAYNGVIENLEAALTNLEISQSRLSDELFLAKTFELRADILNARGSLKHLKSVIRDIYSGKVNIATASTENREPFRYLSDDANDLYDNIEDIRESLQGLVDLRLNVSSFQMNRVMRLLALLTALALIPATVGGLLGMNLTDTPWPGTLAQVAFGVGVGMTLSLYVFAIKGWLK